MWQNINLSGFRLVRWWQEDREPDHIGPQSRVPSFPVVPLGQWPTWPRPGSDKNELYSPLYTFETTFRFRTICGFVSTSPNHIFLHKNVEKCYTDYFLSRPIYSYPSTVNLMYYYTKVLLLRNYFYHHKSEMLWKKVWQKGQLTKSSITHLATRCLLCVGLGC